MSCIFSNRLVSGITDGILNSIVRWKTITGITTSLNSFIDDNGQMSIGSSNFDGMLTLTCRAADVIGLKIKGAESQTEDLLKIVDSDDNSLFVVNNQGDLGVTIDTPNEPLHVQSDFNGNRAIRMGNESDGISAVGRFIVDVLGGSTFLAGYGSNFITSGSKKANSGSLIANAAMENGLSLVARHPTTGHIRFYSGGNNDANEHMIILNDGTVNIGDLSTNYASHAPNGFLTLNGEAKVFKTWTFNFNRSIIIGLGKPTLVNRGVFYGYSLPIFNNDDEELFSCKCQPLSWDGISDPIIYVGGWLDTANDTKKFNLQISVEKCDMEENEIVPITTNDYSIETVTGNVAQYTSYKIAFTIDASAINLGSGNAFALRIRRLAASSDEIAGEFVVEGAVMGYIANKIGSSIS